MAANPPAGQTRPLSFTHTSVDCVVFGFDGSRLNVLLIKRSHEGLDVPIHDMKLPGSIIYLDEDLDEAAARVLRELTGISTIKLQQFKAFGSKDRTSDPADLKWLEKEQNVQVSRIVTVAYFALVKIGRSIPEQENGQKACWVPVEEVPALAFDHNIIIEEGVKHLQMLTELQPDLLFSLLPRKFTAAQLRKLMEVTTEKEMDVRNFSKKMDSMLYVVPTGEKESGVAHRAARLYRFDKSVYAKTRK